MPTLIAIGYQDETGATVAAEEVIRQAAHLHVSPEDVEVVSVDRAGLYRATTRFSGSGSARGSVFWAALLEALVLRPSGAPYSTTIPAELQESVEGPIGPRFATEVRRLLTPGASALFLLVGEDEADLVVDALRRYGGEAVRANDEEGRRVRRHERHERHERDSSRREDPPAR